MAEENGDRMEELFHQAVDLPPERRQALLDRACASDPVLRAALDRLLADDARSPGDEGMPFLESPLVRPAASSTGMDAAAYGPAPPARVGRYRLIRLLGEGGM